MPEWLTFLLADTSALQLVFWLVAIGFLIAAIIKLWPALRRLVTIVDAVTGLPAFIERTDAAIKSIHHETHKNDGSSIKDSTIRTEKLVNEIFDITAALVVKDAELEAAIEHTIPKHELPKEKP